MSKNNTDMLKARLVWGPASLLAVRVSDHSGPVEDPSPSAGCQVRNYQWRVLPGCWVDGGCNPGFYVWPAGRLTVHAERYMFYRAGGQFSVNALRAIKKRQVKSKWPFCVSLGRENIQIRVRKLQGRKDSHRSLQTSFTALYTQESPIIRGITINHLRNTTRTIIKRQWKEIILKPKVNWQQQIILTLRSVLAILRIRELKLFHVMKGMTVQSQRVGDNIKTFNVTLLP